MKKSFLNLLFFLLGLFICSSYAVEVTLLGPKQYQRADGKPKVITNTFPGRIGEELLIVKNGTLEGNNRISSAIISINGQKIYGTNDFNDVKMVRKRIF